jgi:TRAP-type C4-dicarboxylate transport system permease small subunit
VAKQVLSEISKYWHRLVSSLGLAGGVLIVVIAALSTWNIMCRYLLRSPVVWTDEICEYLLLISVFLTLPVSWREDRHVRVDVLYSRWSRKWRARANLAFSFWALLFCASLTWYGFLQAHYALVQGETSITSSAIKTYPVLAFIPIGAFLLCIQILQSTWRLYRDRHREDNGDVPEAGGPPAGEDR